jgi:hypothetical protein
LEPANVRAPRTPLVLRDTEGELVEFPDTADDWASPAWLDYWCHQNAPWLTPKLQQRIVDFTTVLGCRFPTITDIRSPRWAKRALSVAAAWRYRFRRYERPWELDASKRFVRLWDPRVTSL